MNRRFSIHAIQPFLQRVAKDSLFRNSFFLMASTGIISALGFAFWVLCAQLYSPVQVGLAASLISATSLVTNLSFLGFTATLIRYLPQAPRKSAYVSTAIIVTSCAAIILGTLFLLSLRAFLPQLTQEQSYPLFWPLVALYIVMTTVAALCDSLFIAERAAQNVLFKNIVFSSVKIALPIFLVGLGFWGIFLATAAGVAASLVASIILAYRRGIRFEARLDRQVIAETKHFATGNYLGNIFGALPATLLPLLVAAKLGSEAAAFFYMPMMIATLLTIIPSAAAQSLMAEASHTQEKLFIHSKRALLGVFNLLVPAVIIVCIAGATILSIFGQNYSDQGLLLLQLLAVASFCSAINYIGDTMLAIRKRMKAYVCMNALNSLLVLSSVFACMSRWGLAGVGIGWLLGQLATMLIYLAYFGRQELQLARQHAATRQVSESQ